MDFSVQASISPSAAAKLLISGEIDIQEIWPLSAAQKVLEAVLRLSIDDFLSIIDGNPYGSVADIKGIPQFGKFETVLNVPSYFVENGSCCADYPQLGFFLKPDVSATLAANTKFGENHGKAASILGVSSCVHQRIVPSALTYAFVNLDHDQKEEIIRRLLFRVPVVQIILSSAKAGRVNGYAPMSQLMGSTKRRRGQCLRAIFRSLKEYDHTELSERIDNIVWEYE